MNDITAIHALPEPVKTWVLTAFTQAMDDVFLVAVPFMAVAFVIALTMRERPLQGREPAATAEVPATLSRRAASRGQRSPRARW